jgi:hypothetical protein
MTNTGPTVVVPPDASTAIRAFVSISPFSYAALDRTAAVGALANGTDPVDSADSALRAHVGRDYVLANSGRHALDLVLRELALAPDDVVTLLTTSGMEYVSSCVTRTIERHCRWSHRHEDATRAVLAIHEWGRPCERAREHVGGDVPLIEDCAYAFASRYADGTPVGALGDYAVFSLTKMFSVNFGGLAAGAFRSTPFEMPEPQRRYLLERLAPELAQLASVCESRLAVWGALAERFASSGVEPFYGREPGVVPAVFMFAADSAAVPLADVRRAYEALGIEAGVFYGADAVYVPCHQHVGAGTRELLFQVYRELLARGDAAAAATASK